MKLKTLKDLETTEVCCVTNCFDESKEPIIEAKELRKEAIKWIKAEGIGHPQYYYCYTCKRTIKDQRICSDKNHKLATGTDTTIQWIKHFFNITEEELK